MKQSYWYFPGDPPVFDILPHLGALYAVLGLTLPLSKAAFERLRVTYLPNDQVVNLAGWERPVKLHMAHGVPPYVEVDFGGGAHALFDPKTMVCTYSD